MGSERRGRAVHGRLEVNGSGEEPTDRPRQKNAGLWEPYDGRLSRTVLREREVKGRFPPATHHDAIVTDGWTAWPATPPPGARTVIAALTHNSQLHNIAKWIQPIDLTTT